MKFEQALKAMRRNVFVHSGAWRTAVVCPNAHVLAVAWDEARALLEASSLGVSEARYVTRTITLERGAPLRFFRMEDEMDTYGVAGNLFTHVIILRGEYPSGVYDRMRAVLRSPTLPQEALIWNDNVEL